MKGKDEARFAKLVAKFDAHRLGTPESIRQHELDGSPIVHGPPMTSSERRQFRKLLATEEGCGRDWRLAGRQDVASRASRRLRGRHARVAALRQEIAPAEIPGQDGEERQARQAK